VRTLHTSTTVPAVGLKETATADPSNASNTVKRGRTLTASSTDDSLVRSAARRRTERDVEEHEDEEELVPTEHN
jgi:hypothetical protein